VFNLLFAWRNYKKTTVQRIVSLKFTGKNAIQPFITFHLSFCSNYKADYCIYIQLNSLTVIMQPYSSHFQSNSFNNDKKCPSHSSCQKVEDQTFCIIVFILLTRFLFFSTNSINLLVSFFGYPYINFYVFAVIRVKKIAINFFVFHVGQSRV
jgi:hypothetical protein